MGGSRNLEAPRPRMTNRALDQETLQICSRIQETLQESQGQVIFYPKGPNEDP